MTFELTRLRFHLRAAGSLFFPPGKAGNVLRGAFGMKLRETADAPDYHRIFEPRTIDGPSGLADPPRPFVFRAAHLNGRTIPPGEAFHFDAHLFDTRAETRPHFVTAFASWGRAELLHVDQHDVAIDLDQPGERATGVRITFVTPTELKPVTRPEFAVLFARLRDRISTLRALYGPGPLDIGFRALGERAAQVRMTRCELSWQETERRSSRTGQTYRIGGFTGFAEYAGELSEFLPYLRAGQWTGVGRQTVWGKGEICFQVCS
ncbi:MAG TPA: CRISPR system precrRNA processing endoribonuclease RAMP protein Cas6 [Bryobacteraceae bacterium]|nr:CRISPR system precrRNA processing endoribonuclease RAMP protein Cas6 [Bryobacteraceae bacterium]